MSIEARFRIDRGEFSLEVDLDIPSRGVTAIFGPSGCGKTTLLRAIAGLESKRAGYLRVDGEVWQDRHRFLPPHKRPVGYVFQEPSLLAHLNVRRNLEYGLKRLPAEQRTVSLDQAVELLGIGRLLGRSPQQLSGGEQQRVAIARALAVSPALLLLDEPLAALDMDRKEEILPYLESLHRDLDIPVLYVTHSREEVARMAEHLVLMDNGRVQAAGPVRELSSRLGPAAAPEPVDGVVIDAVVAGHDDAFQLTGLDSPGGRFTVARNGSSVGSSVRLLIGASDVSITVTRPPKTSILNVFPATVQSIGEEPRAVTAVWLSIGSARVFARISKKAAVELGLETGSRVFAEIRRVTVQH